MRVVKDQGGSPVEVVLSRRNLLSLLSKLDHDWSARTIFNGDIVVRAEEDDEHYGDRTPGQMHPATEADIARLA